MCVLEWATHSIQEYVLLCELIHGQLMLQDTWLVALSWTLLHLGCREQVSVEVRADKSFAQRKAI